MKVTPNINALAALAAKMNVSAHNVANMNTKGYNARVAEQTSGPAGPSVTVKISGRPPELVDEVIEQKQVIYTYKANLIALKTHDEMMRSALDLADNDDKR